MKHPSLSLVDNFPALKQESLVFVQGVNVLQRAVCERFRKRTKRHIDLGIYAHMVDLLVCCCPVILP